MLYFDRLVCGEDNIRSLHSLRGPIFGFAMMNEPRQSAFMNMAEHLSRNVVSLSIEDLHVQLGFPYINHCV